LLVNETLRWRPVAPGGVPHFTKTEDNYMGFRIPANSIVMANHFAVTRDESVFGPDALNFVPDRWLAADDLSNTEPTIDACGMNVTALKDLPQTGFGFGRRMCTGRHVARNQLFMQIARMLWAFDVEAGVDETTGLRRKVDDMDCTEGIVALPKRFRAEMRPRGQWVRDVMMRSGTSTHDIDHAEVLNQAGRERV
jgi:cytochrome P450